MTGEDLKVCTYSVDGMHCAACEVLIEKKILKQNGVKSVEASTKDGRVDIVYEGQRPQLSILNKAFKGDNYSFSSGDSDYKKSDESIPFIKFSGGEVKIDIGRIKKLLYISGISILLIIGFVLINRSEVAALVSVNASSSLPAFFVFGLLAGASSCAALVGGIVLSMSKQWNEQYVSNNSFFSKFEPHLLFNGGRLLSFMILGAVLGAIGGVLQISLSFTSVLTIGISIMMFVLALQMLGWKRVQGLQFKTPKFISRYVADESNFRGRLMPAVMGALTFFLPCGFTITAQGLALASGNALQGSLIMLFFSLGTLPMLLTIGLSSVRFLEQKNISDAFLKIAGVLVLFFALYNFNSQLVVLNLPSINDVFSSSVQAADTNLPPIVDGKQIVRMDASSGGYSPNYIKVRMGVPVRWEITDKGTSGCTNAVISKALFDGEIKLTPGETSVKEFTPEKPGRYKFSCWMGMVTGTIEVVDGDGNSGEIVQVGDFEDDSSTCEGGCGENCDGSCGCGSTP